MDGKEKGFSARCREMASACTRCGVCVAGCAFLQEYGMPGDIADRMPDGSEEKVDPFECSLCGLCDAVCPDRLACSDFFLSMRRARAVAQAVDHAPYASILDFERRGDSDGLSLILVPEGGDTVLFPGCGLAATRRKTVRRLFRSLQDVLPDIGVALGCCLKPSHDLARTAFFAERFERLRMKLAAAGVRRVVTACPNCQKIFSEYGQGIEAVTAYAMLADSGFEPVGADGGEAVVHDPCPQRFDTVTQDAVRTLAKRAGMTLLPSPRERAQTLCCGEGGMVPFVRQEFSDYWTQECAGTVAGDRVITSCSGCVGYLGRSVRAEHILDVLFDSRPRMMLAGPLADMARKRLKRWFRNRLG